MTCQLVTDYRVAGPHAVVDLVSSSSLARMYLINDACSIYRALHSC